MSFFSHCCWESSMLFDSFDYATRISEKVWKWKGSGIYSMERRLGLYCFLFICKTLYNFNTFFAFIQLSFLKIILISFNFANIIISYILHKTLSRSSFKSAWILKRIYIDQPAQKLCVEVFKRHSKRATVV